jgi:hypothetical protein
VKPDLELPKICYAREEFPCGRYSKNEGAGGLPITTRHGFSSGFVKNARGKARKS